MLGDGHGQWRGTGFSAAARTAEESDRVPGDDGGEAHIVLALSTKV